MKTLPVTHRDIMTIYYRTLNKFINEVYNKNYYNIVEDIDTPNNSVLYYEIKKRGLDMGEVTMLYKFVNKNIIGGVLPLLLLDLCNKSIIEEGYYLVEIYW
jgi:hypothetical protein